MKAQEANTGRLSLSAASAAVLILVIAVVGIYVIPPVIYTTFGYSAGGTVAHKMIGQTYDSKRAPDTWTVGITLLSDDPINGIKSGETLAYIVSRSDWERVQWGDTVKIRTFPNYRAEIVGLYPSLGPANPSMENLWRLSIEMTSNRSTYKAGESVSFSVNVTRNWNYNLTLCTFRAYPFWVYMNGSLAFESQGDRTLQNVTLQSGKPWISSFEWDLSDSQGRALSAGFYYLRTYLGQIDGGGWDDIVTATILIEIET